MDITSPSLVPRVVADLRPSADAAANARTTAPPLAVALDPVVQPAATSQGALVARSLLGMQAVPPVGPADPAEVALDPAWAEAPPRVLKPWGVPMLPFEERPRGPGA